MVVALNQFIKEEINSVGNTEEENWDDFLPSEETGEKSKIVYEDSDSDVDIPEDPYHVRTKKTFANNPYNKALTGLVCVGSGVFFFLYLFRLFMGGYGGYTTEDQSANISRSEGVESEPASIFDDISSSTPDGDLEMHKALNEQSDEIKQVEQLTAKVTPSEVKVEEPISSSPPPTSVAPIPKPSPSPQPKPIQQVSYSAPPPRQIPVTRSAVPPPKTVVKKKEPMQQWLEAANMGSYGATNFEAETLANNISDENAHNLAESNSEKVVSVSYRSEPSYASNQARRREATKQLYANASNTYSTISPNQFMRGTSVNAEVELPIVWMVEAGEYNQQRDYLVRLKQPLLGATGVEIAPKGSMAVVKAQEFYGNTGFIQLEVTSLIVEEEGMSREYPVPANSLIVLNKKGGVLEAEADKKNNLDTGALLLSGVARAASVSSNPTSSINSFGTSITTFGERDLVGGFIEGVTNSAVDSIKQRQANAINNAQGEPTVYVIEAGTDVRLVVNKSFSLE